MTKTSSQLQRYQSVLWLLIKHGSTLFSKPDYLEVNELLPPADATEDEAAQHLTHQLEQLGPTFIKLGQALANRSDLLPKVYLDALSRLQDDVSPVSYDEIEAIIQDEFDCSINDLFNDFSHEPIASASIGQVHSASLKNGQAVIVKVQKPGVRETVISDLETLETAAKYLEQYLKTAERLGVLQMLDEFRRTLLLELDYHQEAQNLNTMQSYMQSYEKIRIPIPINTLVSSRVLVMEYMQGIKITELSVISRLDYQTEPMTEQLYKAYLDQILIHGFVHGDPHPGNILINEANELILLDLGMCLHLDPAKRIQLLKMMIAVNEGRGEEAAEISLELNTPLPEYDHENFIRQTAALVAQTINPSGVYKKTGRVILEMVRIATVNGVRVAPELVLVGKTLLYLDEILENLQPGFDPGAVLKKHMFSVLRQQARQRLRTGRILASSMEVQDLIARAPRRLNQLIDRLARNEFKISIDAMDEDRLLANLEKIANRISTGLVLAAMLISAAIMMHVETEWTVFGYPIIAMVLFLFSAFTGVFLILSALLSRN